MFISYVRVEGLCAVLSNHAFLLCFINSLLRLYGRVEQWCCKYNVEELGTKKKKLNFIRQLKRWLAITKALNLNSRNPG